MAREVLTSQEQALLAARLRAARRSKQLTQQDVAERVGMSRTTLVAIEKAERPVRSTELMDLAVLYGHSVNDLLRPTPVAEDFQAQLRSAPGSGIAEDEIEGSIALLQELADDYVELERLAAAPLPQRYPPEASLEGMSPSEAAESLAASERNRLGLGDGPVLDLRQLLETDVGLRIFAVRLPSRVAGLFVNSALYGACVAINSQHPFERQRWSLAHEYAHFLAQRSQSEVTVLHGYRRVPVAERFADAFAENFLMPTAGLKRRFHELKQARREGVTPADLLHLADRFRVSFEAMARRLENLDLIRRHTLDRLVNEGFRVSEARQLLELAARPPDDDLLPLRYRYLAVQAWSSGQITEGQLARFLHLDRTSARRLTFQLSHRIGLDQGGIASSVEIDTEQDVDVVSH
jgi:Zn-dependent peptidase ImmA (M78 family)/transcriptional regulator with XRE-family HTH domain